MRALNSLGIDNGLAAKSSGSYRVKLEQRDDSLQPVARAFIPVAKEENRLYGRAEGFDVELSIDIERLKSHLTTGDIRTVIGSGRIRRGDKAINVNLFPAYADNGALMFGIKPKSTPEAQDAKSDFLDE